MPKFTDTDKEMNSYRQSVSALAAYMFVCCSFPEQDPYNLKGLERMLDDMYTQLSPS